MARVATEAITGLDDDVRMETVVTKTPAGAARYRQLTKDLGRFVTVPSILINGRPVYDSIPGVDELRQTLVAMMSDDKVDDEKN